jgi:hypothetical protein
LDTEFSLRPPTPEQLFRPESEAAWRARIAEEAARRGLRVEFPRDAPFDRTAGPAPGCPCFPPGVAIAAPDAVCYQPLYFEDRNTERYGWRVPGVQPLLSAGRFYFDVLALPYHLVELPPWACGSDYGCPLPGDPVPYRIQLPGDAARSLDR